MKLHVLSVLLLMSVPLAVRHSGGVEQLQSAIRQYPELGPILAAVPVVSSGIQNAPNGIGVPVADELPVPFQPMVRNARTPTWAFPLPPGAWQLRTDAYTTQPGAVRHEAGEGYVVAPLLGPGADLFQRILQRAAARDVPQRDVQALLWAVLSRGSLATTRLIRGAAAQLLTEQEIASIERNQLGRLAPALRAQLPELLPYPLSQRVHAQAEIRELLGSVEARYEDFERVAVSQEGIESVMGDRDLLDGRWSYVGGMFVRPAPQPSEALMLEVIVPQNRRPVITRDAASRIIRARYGNGVQIAVEYEDRIVPFQIPGDPGARGYVFKSIRIDGPGLKPREILGTGWTFAGRAHGGGTVAAAEQTSLAPGLAERYADLVWWANGSELPHLKTNADRAVLAADVTDDQSLRAGVRQALERQPSLDAAIVAALDLTAFEWMHCRLAASRCQAAGADPTVTANTVIFDPTSIVIVSGNQGRQRFMTSGRERK